MLNTGIIGYGYWGPNLVRNFMAARSARVVSVCDQSAARLEKVKELARQHARPTAAHAV